MTVSLSTLILTRARTFFYDAALSIANLVGLPVTSWQAGDPTRALLNAHADAEEERDALDAGFIRSGFLDYAEGEWLRQHAAQQFGVVATDPTYATAELVLTNPGGGFYPDIEAGDLTFKNSTTGKTYHNTTGGTLASGPGTTLALTVVADEPGSDSSAAAGEVNYMVTPLGSTTCTNALAAIGVDGEAPDALRARCRARRGRATSNGPRDSFTDVALDPLLTGTSAVTRARAFRTSSQGDVTVYLAGPSGAVAEADRALVEAAILSNATPLCVTPTVLSCTNVVVAVTYEVWVYKRANLDVAAFKEAAEAALEQLFAAQPIGGDIIAPATTGTLYTSRIAAAISGVSDDVFRVTVTLPVADTALANSQVPALGIPLGTVNIASDPT